MTVGLSMIVRDAEADLPACLASVAGWVDEVVIGDTGSRDASRSLARSLGATVLDIPWRQDFAAARNQVLAGMHCDWVLVLDADERLEPGTRARWSAQFHAGADAYQVTIRNYVDSLSTRIWDRPARPNDGAWPEARAHAGFIEHQNVRLFRRHPELYFVGRVHESVGPRVRPAGLKLGTAGSRIHHFGLVRPPEVIAAKNRFYLELGQQKVAEQPGDPQAHFELGVILFDNFGRDGEALRSFERALRLQPGFAQAWFFAGAALRRLNHPQEALAFFEQAQQRGCQAPELGEFLADCAYNLGQFDRAAEGYRRALRRSAPAAAQSVVRSKRGLAEVRAGRREQGVARLQAALEATPDNEALHDRLITALVWLEDWPAAARASEERVQRFPGDPQSYLRLAALLARSGHADRAAWWLRAGLRHLPADAQLRAAWRELQRALPHRAASALKPATKHADRSA